MFGKAAVQSSHIRSANGPQPARLPTFWSPSRRLGGDVRSTAGSPWADEESLRQDWSEQPWRTGRWHNHRIKKYKFIHLRLLWETRSSTHTQWKSDKIKNIRLLISSTCCVYFFHFNNEAVTSSKASSCLIWHKILSISFGTGDVLFSNCVYFQIELCCISKTQKSAHTQWSSQNRHKCVFKCFFSPLYLLMGQGAFKKANKCVEREQ